jgi:hypothetical protein
MPKRLPPELALRDPLCGEPDPVPLPPLPPSTTAVPEHPIKAAHIESAAITTMTRNLITAIVAKMHRQCRSKVMAMKRAFSLMVSLVVATAFGCHKETAPKDKEKKGGEQTCQEYIAALDACIAKLPADQRADMQKTRDAQAKALKDAPQIQKEQMGDGCRTGLATLKQHPACK